MNSFIWRKKNITGGSADTSNLVTLNSAQTISGSKTFSGATTMNVLHMNNTTIDQLANPTQPQNAATKSYVDTNKYGDAFTKVYENTVTNNVTNSNWTQVIDYTNMLNNFTIAANTVYEVLVKQNSGSKDVYANVVIGVNAANYDNSAITQYLPWGLTGTDSVQYAISLKNNQIKLWVKRGSTSTGNWNASTQIFIRKIGAITIA